MKIKLSKIAPIIVATIAGGLGGFAFASGELKHDTHVHLTGSSSNHPREQGQSAFAAISEIVSMLENNEETDWSAVNINALREHLVDMNALTLGAEVTSERTESNIIFKASGAGVALRALQNMVPAHANELDKMEQWSVSGEIVEGGAILTVSPHEPSDLTRIEALGFFGIMATGGHHRAHHLAMASGSMAH